ITLLLSFSILPNKAHTQETLVSSINVDGNKRISSDTIISLSKVQLGSAYSPTQLNSALQSIKKIVIF
ncbi:POTRA domain-containing protein, partial [Amylibacter sp.]|nr:POTRA domain-containing protein [Amylibacter sp.]